MTDCVTPECVTFALGEQVYATPLPAVREILRLEGLQRLPAMRPPLAGVLDLRGSALPVLDVRAADAGHGERGNVLVLEPVAGAEPVGVAVDRVLAVGPEGLTRAHGRLAPGVLPAYVVGVLLDASGRQVFLVDLRAMVTLAAA